MVDPGFLREAPVLQGLSEEELEQIVAIARPQRFARGECVLQRGGEADAFYIATEGTFTLTISMRAMDRDVDLAIQELGERDAFGWSALLRPHRWTHSVYCTREGEAAVFPAEELRGLLVGHGGVGLTFVSNVGELMSSRLQVVQKFWLGEVQRSMERVSHWLGSEANVTLREAIASEQPPEHRRRWPWRRSS